MKPLPPAPSPSRPERGQSLLEIALALPVLFLLLFAVINAAAIVRSWQALQQAAFAGARAAAVTRDPAYAGGIVLANLKAFGDQSDPRFPIYAIYSTESGNLQPRNPHTPPPGPQGVYCHSVAVAEQLNESTSALAPDAQNYIDQYHAASEGQCPAAVDGDHTVTVIISYEARAAGPFFPNWTLPLRAQATARIEDGP